MFFTQEDYRKIEAYLKLNSKKDTDFIEITDEDTLDSLGVKDTDWVSIVQRDGTYSAHSGNHRNVIILIKDLTYDMFKNILLGTEERLLNLIDSVPTKDSIKLVRSNGVWHAINDPKVIHEELLDDDVVSTRTIIDKNVTNPKLADDAVDRRVIKDGEVIASKLGQEIHNRFENIETDAKELHRKTEKFTTYLTISKSGSSLPNGTTLEITGNENIISMTGTAMIETYGDEPSQTIPEYEIESKKLTITRDGTTLFDMAVAATTYPLPNVIGAYNIVFTAAYNSVLKIVSSVVNLNLRKYFGFDSIQPIDPTTLSTSHFSNSVGCTVTIPANGTGFKRVYFAVPNDMIITRVLQPDALNAPLAIQQISTITRTIAGTTYTYKLYQSIDEIDASVNKKLTIS